MNYKGKYHKKKRKKNLQLLGILLIGLTLFIVGFAYSYTSNLLSSMEQEEITRSDEALGIGEPVVMNDTGDASSHEDKGNPEVPYYYDNITGIYSIALYGVDAPAGEAGRSDTIMILTVDTNNDTIRLSSIVRDTYVNIPGRGMDKITHAYAYGGAQLALKTLNSNFQLNIKDFMAVNFTSLPKIINIIGGIPMKITSAEATQITGIETSGTYNLNGDQALEFSRIRQIDSDFERSRRQRDVIQAVIKKMLSKNVTTYPGVLQKLLPLVKTSMDSNSIMGMATTVVTNGIKTVEQNRFPQEGHATGKVIDGTYYYVFEINETLHSIGKFVYLGE